MVIRNKCEAQLLLSQERIRKVPEKIKTILEKKAASFAQTQELLGELNFALTSVMRKVGRVALRPPYDVVMGGGGALGKRASWA